MRYRLDSSRKLRRGDLPVPPVYGMLTAATAAMILCGLSLCAAAEPEKTPLACYPLASGSAWWQPYSYDEATVGIYHLDEIAGAGAAGDTSMGEPLPEKETSTDVAAGSAMGVARNARPMGQDARLAGSAEFVRNGRFGGALSFKEGGGRLVFPDGGRTEQNSVEMWVKIDVRPDVDAVIWSCISGTKPTLSMHVKGDGSLHVAYGGKDAQVDAGKTVFGEWVHLALEWGLIKPSKAGQMQMFVNGKLIWSGRLSGEDIAPLVGPGILNVGGGPAGTLGFSGLVDEIRISSSLRQFYDLDTELHALATRPLAEAGALSGRPPFVRDAGDLIFHARFNQSPNPDLCAKGTQAKASATASASGGDEALELKESQTASFYQEGLEGQALLLGKGGLEIEYDGNGNVDSSGGTIAFWIRPSDWDNFMRDNPYDRIYPTAVDIFHLMGTLPESIKTHEHWNPRIPMARFILWQNMSPGVQQPIEFQPGRWVHLAVAWEGSSLHYFVNGKPWTYRCRLDENNPQWSTPGSFAFVICDEDKTSVGYHPDDKYWPICRLNSIRFKPVDFSKIFNYAPQPRTAEPHTLIDDFRVYRRPLSPAEIANLPGFCDPRVPQKPLPPAELLLETNGAVGRVNIELYPLNCEFSRIKDVLFSLSLKDAGPSVASAVMPPDSLGIVRGVIKTPQLKFGEYSLAADMRDASGSKIAAACGNFEFKQPPWWKSTAGISEKVMPEWTPMKEDSI